MLFGETPTTTWFGLQTMAYVIAGVCFILSLGGLSQHESARRGNTFGIIGIVIAILATLLSFSGSPILLGSMLVVGSIIGIAIALSVDMNAMPQLVAILHSFVGLAAVLVGISNYCAYDLIDLAALTQEVAAAENIDAAVKTISPDASALRTIRP